MDQGDEAEQVVLIDCLTLLLANVLMQTEGTIDSDGARLLENAQPRVDAETEALLCACRDRSRPTIIVSGEVGQGIVPEHRLGRVYRDLLGWANQAIAAQAESVYSMIAGLPVEVRSLAVSLASAADGLCEMDGHA